MAELDPRELEEFRRSLEKAGLSAEAVEKALAVTAKSIKMAGKTFDNIKKGLSELEDEVKDGSKSYSDLTSDLNYYAKQVKKLTDVKQREEAQTKLNELASKAMWGTAKDAVGKMAGAVASGAASYYVNQIKTGIRGVMGDGSPFQVAADLQIAAIESVSETASAVGGAVSTAGSALMMIPHPAGKVAGALAMVAGGLLDFGAKKTGELMKFAVEVTAKELEKTYKSFQQATAAGALFAGGMTEIRNTALKAGLTQEQYTQVIANNSAALAAFGGDVTNGAKKMANVTEYFARDNGKVRKQLLNLGISVEEQTEGVANYMDMLQRTGNLRGKSDAELAKGSEAYLTNLKAISAFTGEDVKAAQKRARDASTQAAVQSKLAGMGKGATEKFNAMIATLPPSLQKAAQQMLVFGDAIDPESAAALAQIPAFSDVMKRSMADVEDQNVSLADATERYQKDVRDNQDLIKEQGLNASSAVGAANLATGAYANMTQVLSDVTNIGLKNFEDKTQTTTQGVEKAKNTQDELTIKVGESVQALQTMKLAIQKELTFAITNFAKQVPEILQGLRDKLRELGLLNEQGQAKIDVEKAEKDYKKAFEGGSRLQRWYQVGMTPEQEKAHKNLQNAKEGKDVANAQDYDWSAGVPQFDGGGFASGPKSGYLAMLHGTEKVEPVTKSELTDQDTFSGKLKELLNFGTLAGQGNTELMVKAIEKLSELNEQHLKQQKEILAHSKDTAEILSKLYNVTA